MTESVPLAFVVSTIGRRKAIDKLLTTLLPQLGESDAVSIVWQGEPAAMEDLFKLWRDPRILWNASSLGLSKGRNLGVSSLPKGDFILSFPNDTTYFPSGVVDALRKVVNTTDFSVGAVSIRDSLGPKRDWPTPGTPLDKFNVWRVIEIGLLFRKELFDQVGGFREDLGTGCPSPWQSGEGTDLLLRTLTAFPRIASSFRWTPASVWFGGVTESHGLSPSQRRRKLRAYGRGFGYVVRATGYPPSWKGARVLGGFLIGFRHVEYSPLDGLWSGLGRLEGMIGILFPMKQFRAVSN